MHEIIQPGNALDLANWVALLGPGSTLWIADAGGDYLEAYTRGHDRLWYPFSGGIDISSIYPREALDGIENGGPLECWQLAAAAENLVASVEQIR